MFGSLESGDGFFFQAIGHRYLCHINKKMSNAHESSYVQSDSASMMSEIEVSTLFWSVGLLLVPLLIAMPARLIWRYVVGRTHEENTYRQHVNRIIHAGMIVEHFREELDDIAKNLQLTASKARLIEADLLYPLQITHFLLLPALLVLPLAFFMALPVMIIGFPVLIILEQLLIKQKNIDSVLKLLGYAQNNNSSSPEEDITKPR